ncbi:MAG: glutamate racemase [Anaerolineae bacterium]
MADNRPIGVFDSGVGGVTVWAQIAARLPAEATVYLADGAHCPYGPRPPAEVIALSTGITRFLLAQNCKMVVVACNTASAAALLSLRSRFAVPVVGMEPAVKPAALATQSGHIGILATHGTLNGSLFNNTSRAYAANVTIHAQTAHGLVELVESGKASGARAETLLRQYLEPMLAAGVDQLVLGCTHYPFLIPVIQTIVNGRAAIHNPAEAVARQVSRLLARHALAAAPEAGAEHHFFSTGNPRRLKRLLVELGRPAAVVAPAVWRAGRLDEG